MCEDFPCCGHERGDCEGKLYGSDARIMAAVDRYQELADMGIFQDFDH